MRSALACSPLLALLALAVAFGCSSTDTSAAGGGSSPSGPPSLTITKPATGACVEVPLDRAAGVPITFVTSGVSLRAPGDCAQLDVCGHVVLYVGDQINNAGANAVIDALSMPDAPLQGPFEVTLRLVDDTGTPMIGANGSAVVAKLALVAQASCGESSSGSGGTGGTTSTTGSGGTGGTIGSGGTGAMGGSLTTTGSGSGSGGSMGGTGAMGGSLTTTGSGSGSGGAPSGAGGSSSSGT